MTEGDATAANLSGPARFAIRHRRFVLICWAVLAIAGATVAADLPSKLQRAFTAPGSESARGSETLERVFGDNGEYAFVVVANSGGAPAARASARLEEAGEALADLLPNGRAGRPAHAGGSVSYLPLSSSALAASIADLTPAARSRLERQGPVSLTLTGPAALEYDSRTVLADDLAKAELLALPIAALILALILRTAVAMLVPIVFALVVIPISLGLVWIVANLTPMSIYVTNIATLLGLALSLDYSLLVVSRLREERERLADGGAALERAVGTAGRTVALSALAVATGLSILLFIPLPFMRSMGIAGLLVPLVAAAASVTLLPALLAAIGERIDRGPISWIGKRAPSKARKAHCSAAERHPARAAAVGFIALIALALPATAIAVTGGDQRSLPSGTSANKGYETLAAALGPGALTPYAAVIEAPGGADGRSAPGESVDRLLRALNDDREVSYVPSPPAVSRRSRDGVVEVLFFGRHASGSADAAALVKRFRNRYSRLVAAPETVLLAGAAARGVDFVESTYDDFELIVLGVLAVTFLVVLVAFRSLVLPAKAVLLNCLSVAAALGAVVLGVNSGLGSSHGLGESGQVEAWVPAFLVAVLFGLSMDYHIFVVSRIREEWLLHGSTDDAVSAGIAQTGRVVRAAGAIMIVTFLTLLTSSFTDLQKLGLGLSVGIALDVFLVRTLLVPAAMRLLGKWNWYLPRSAGNKSNATVKPWEAKR